MTKRTKWAFENKEGAAKFVKDNGGQIATLGLAMKATYEVMYKDTNMIREKRKMKRGVGHQKPGFSLTQRAKSPIVQARKTKILSLWTIGAIEASTMTMQLMRIRKKVYVICSSLPVTHGRVPCLASDLYSSIIPDAQDMAS